MTTNIEKFIARFKNLELVEMTIPVSGKHGMYHRRVKNKENARYFVDYWHTGKFRALDGSFQHSGYEDKALRLEIEKLAGYREKTTPIEEVNTHGEIVTFGKHKGERWTRIPVSYLRWLANESDTWRQMALAELQRRGTVMDAKVEISGHAIDRASLNCRRLWHETSEEGEGINAWLVRIATEAIEARGELELIRWKGLKLAFTYGEYYPILKTIMPYKNTITGKSTFSVTRLLNQLTGRIESLKEKREKSSKVVDKKDAGIRLSAYHEIVSYIKSQLREDKDIALDDEKV